MLGEASDILINTHLIVVKDDYHPGLAVAQVVDRFVSKAAGKRAVADDRYDIELLSFEIPCPGNTHCSGDRSRAVARIESIIRRFRDPGESGDAFLLS